MFVNLVSIVSDPILAYVLLIIGIYGLFLECFSPGLFFPGLLGVVCAFLGVLGLSHLPVSPLGMALLVIGLVLMVVNVFTCLFYILGAAGVVAFALGSVYLYQPTAPLSLALPWGVIVVVSIVTGFFFLFILRFVRRARKQRVVSGVRGMIGKVGVIGPSGDWVLIMGERWHYSAAQRLEPGQRVRVLQVKDAVLKVELVTKQEESE